MKKNNLNSSSRSSVWMTGLLVLWSVLSVLTYTFFNQTAWLLSTGFYVLVVIITLSNLNPSISWLTLLFSGGLSIYVNQSLYTSLQDFYLHTGWAVLSFIVARQFARVIYKQYRELSNQLIQDQELISEQVVFDADTGIMRWKFANRRLDQEIARSKRLELPLSLLLMEISQKHELSEDALISLYKSIGELAQKNIQEDIDIPFIEDKMGWILPESNLADAQETALEIVNDIKKVLNINLTIGIANMADHSETREAMIARADQALAYGLENGQSVVTDQQFINETHEMEVSESINMEEFAYQPVNEASNVEADPDQYGNSYFGTNDWLVWIEGFEDDSVVQWMNEKFYDSESVKFLGWQDGQMVAKITLGQDATAEFGKAFPDFAIKAVDPNRHFVMLCPDYVKSSVDILHQFDPMLINR